KIVARHRINRWVLENVSDDLPVKQTVDAHSIIGSARPAKPVIDSVVRKQRDDTAEIFPIGIACDIDSRSLVEFNNGVTDVRPSDSEMFCLFGIPRSGFAEHCLTTGNPASFNIEVRISPRTDLTTEALTERCEKIICRLFIDRKSV